MFLQIGGVYSLQSRLMVGTRKSTICWTISHRNTQFSFFHNYRHGLSWLEHNKNMRNYSKSICGLAYFHFIYLWFKTKHFAHLCLVPFGLCYPPPLKLWVNKSFCFYLIYLSSKNIRTTKIKKETRTNRKFVKKLNR